MNISAPGQPVEDLLRTLDVRLSAFAVCEIGKGWRLNIAPLGSMVCHFVLRGEGAIEAAGKRTAIGPDTVIIVPPGIPKGIAGPGEVTQEAAAEDSCVLHSQGLLAFRARGEQADLLLGCASLDATYGGRYGIFDYLQEPVVIELGGNELIRLSFTALLDELARPKLATMVIAECLMKQVMVWLLRDYMDQLLPRGPSRDTIADPRLLPVLAAVIARPEQPHSVGTLASLAGMSRSAFAARFVEHYSTTPMEFVQNMRMRSAARLLQTSELPIKCLAGAVGYSSRSQFSRAFKNTYGIDPSSYRTRGFSGAEGWEATNGG